MTKEHPILFSGAMVRAILDSRKTQTRRAVKPQPTSGLDGWDWSWPIPGKNVTPGTLDRWRDDAKNPLSPHYCPYGKPGDRLWVRETWQHSNHPFGPYDPGCLPFYRADYLDDPLGPDLERSADGIRRQWRPSIHMPRSASRITLEITGVRVERLNDCSESDAKAEGITPREVRQMWLFGASAEERAATYRRAAVEPFRHLWEQINGAGAWEANPWVWVVEFRRAAP